MREQVGEDAPAAKKGLIADDAAFMRKVLHEILTQNGFEVVGEAGDGAEAVAKFMELAPDFVTMDITMPEMDGIEALKRIRAFDHEATVIMCSAMGQQQMVVEAIRHGARDFIVKPFQAERVVESINKALS